MTFEEEINRFFRGYKGWRETVENDEDYQIYAKQKNAIKCLEIAAIIIHQNAQNALEYKVLKASKILSGN